MSPRIALTVDERHTLQALRDGGSVAVTAARLGVSLSQLSLELTAIRTRLGVNSTAAALAHLQD